MHIIDTLDAGGAERMAVNLVNNLPPDRFAPYLCTTRRPGRHTSSLENLVAAGVQRLDLNRAHRFDVAALRRLRIFIRQNNIHILHAHGASLFIAACALLFSSRSRLIWHDHFGLCEIEQRPAWLYRLAAKRAAGVVAVNDILAHWSASRLSVSPDRVWRIPNFASAAFEYNGAPLALPGTPGSRIVCVANFRPQKDHLNLIRAFALVAQQMPDAHLLLVGSAPNQQSDQRYLTSIRDQITRHNLHSRVTLLGSRTDVAVILRDCDIAVLSSSSEALPLALLEYGVAALPVVATRVGECPAVLDHGKAGLLVAPNSPQDFSTAILSLLHSRNLRSHLGERLRDRVANCYSASSAIRQLCQVYETVLSLHAHRSEQLRRDDQVGQTEMSMGTNADSFAHK
ncbi:MAG: glycosyltransferase [Candidatus Acidiferrum sp.]